MKEEDRAVIAKARHQWLTPIGRGLPPRGSMARQMMLAEAKLRRAGRLLAKALPYSDRVSYPAAGRSLYNWLVWVGLAYMAMMLVFFALHWAGVL